MANYGDAIVCQAASQAASNNEAIAATWSCTARSLQTGQAQR